MPSSNSKAIFAYPMKIKDKIPQGFTLVEVLVAFSLVMVVLVGLWGGVSFSGKTTKNAILQSDALNAADSTFRKLKMFLASCEKIECPVADTSSDYAIVIDEAGRQWALTLADNKLALIVAAVDGNGAYKLYSLSSTLLKFTKVDFHNLGGKELRVTVSMDNINDSELLSLTSFVSVFKVGL